MMTKQLLTVLEGEGFPKAQRENSHLIPPASVTMQFSTVETISFYCTTQEFSQLIWPCVDLHGV